MRACSAHSGADAGLTRIEADEVELWGQLVEGRPSVIHERRLALVRVQQRRRPQQCPDLLEQRAH